MMSPHLQLLNSYSCSEPYHKEPKKSYVIPLCRFRHSLGSLWKFERCFTPLVVSIIFFSPANYWPENEPGAQLESLKYSLWYCEHSGSFPGHLHSLWWDSYRQRRVLRQEWLAALLASGFISLFSP